MSIAVAVRKGNDIVIAADTQDSFGVTTVTADNYSCRKIIKVGASYVATTGWGLYEDIFEHYLASGVEASFDSRSKIFSFFMLFWKELHEQYNFVKDQSSEEDPSPFGDLDATFLITNPNGIFYVSSNMSVSKFEKYFAIGAGSNFSLGTLYALYDLDFSAEEIARKSVESAMEFNIYCGGAVDLFHINAT